MDAMLQSERAGDVLRLVLDRPARRNALSRALIVRLAERLREAERDRAVRAVILTGAPPAFCAGLDLTEVEAALAASGRFDTGPLADLLDLIQRLECPVVAAVNGVAAAGGAALVCVCDHVLMAASATIGYPGIRRGLVAPVVIPTLAAAVGPRRARSLLLSGRMLAADEALRAGLCDEVVADGGLAAQALARARSLAAIDPEALAATKRLLRRTAAAPRNPARFRRVWRAAAKTR